MKYDDSKSPRINSDTLNRLASVRVQIAVRELLEQKKSFSKRLRAVVHKAYNQIFAEIGNPLSIRVVGDRVPSIEVYFLEAQKLEKAILKKTFSRGEGFEQLFFWKKKKLIEVELDSETIDMAYAYLSYTLGVLILMHLFLDDCRETKRILAKYDLKGLYANSKLWRKIKLLGPLVSSSELKPSSRINIQIENYCKKMIPLVSKDISSFLIFIGGFDGVPPGLTEELSIPTELKDALKEALDPEGGDDDEDVEKLDKKKAKKLANSDKRLAGLLNLEGFEHVCLVKNCFGDFGKEFYVAKVRTKSRKVVLVVEPKDYGKACYVLKYSYQDWEQKLAQSRSNVRESAGFYTRIVHDPVDAPPEEQQFYTKLKAVLET